jgi:hypothetical protein
MAARPRTEDAKSLGGDQVLVEIRRVDQRAVIGEAEIRHGPEHGPAAGPVEPFAGAAGLGVQHQEGAPGSEGGLFRRREELPPDAASPHGGVHEHLADLGAERRVLLVGQGDHHGSDDRLVDDGDEEDARPVRYAGELTAPEGRGLRLVAAGQEVDRRAARDRVDEDRRQRRQGSLGLGAGQPANGCTVRGHHVLALRPSDSTTR